MFKKIIIILVLIFGFYSTSYGSHIESPNIAFLAFADTPKDFAQMELSLKDIDAKNFTNEVIKMWKVFETVTTNRGIVVKPNYQPFEQKIRTVIFLDTAREELKTKSHALTINFLIDTQLAGQQVGDSGKAIINNIRLEKKSNEMGNIRCQLGYKEGRLSEEYIYYITFEEFKYSDMNLINQVKMDTIASLAKGKDGIPISLLSSAHQPMSIGNTMGFKDEFFDLKLKGDIFYPQDIIEKHTFIPGQLVFGSILKSDVIIEYYKDIQSGNMVNGKLSWKIILGDFTSGEEIGLMRSYFSYIQEELAKQGVIKPPVNPLNRQY